MIILIGSNKGGSGKTTVATNLAAGLVLQGHDVVLVDADRQRSAHKWQQYRLEEGIKPDVLVVACEGNITRDLDMLDAKYDFVIVDVAGRNSRELITGAAVADLLIAPHQASQLDLDTLDELQEQLARIRDINPGLEALVCQAMASTNPTVREVERKEFLVFTADFTEIKLMSSVIFYRKTYRDVISCGQSVLESNNAKARAEITEFITEILEGRV